jgi:alanine racemase
MHDGVTVVFDLQALQHNLQLIRLAVGQDKEVIACLKADAYGHGLESVAHFLEGEGVRWFSVVKVADAMALRRSGIRSRVLLLPAVGKRPNKLICDAGITITIQSYEEAEDIAREFGAKTSVFLKVDSGLGRLGASLTDALPIVRRIVSELPSIRLEGVYTHIPFSDRRDIPWVKGCLEEFGKCAASIRHVVGPPLLVQALASGGILSGLEVPEANAVSPGQLLFGLELPLSPLKGDRTLSFGSKPVLKEIRASLGAIREIPAETRYGFGGALFARKKTRLGVIPAGFSNSVLLPRDGQTANVLGHIVPIIAVSLEHAVLDVTDVRGVSEGSAVILLSSDSIHGLTLEKVAQLQARMPVEVLVSLIGKSEPRYVGTSAIDRIPIETS